MKVLIIGGGVMGLCSAYYARQRGLEVTVVERDPEERNGCSFGNAGMIVPSHFVPLAAPGMVALGLKWMWNPESPFYIKPRFSYELMDWAWKFWRAANAGHVEKAGPLLRNLHIASRSCFEELAELPDNDFGLRKNGLLMLCREERTWEEEGRMAARARALGITAQVLDSKETAELDPHVRMEVRGSVYFPEDCHLIPNRFMAGLLRILKAQGVTFRWRTEVTGWRVEDRKVSALETTEGDMRADEYLICGGVWSPSIGKDLALTIPMQAGKGYSMTMEAPRQLPTICSIFTEARVAVTPMGSSLRFGGTMEIAGVNDRVDPRRVRGIVKSVPRYYPEFRVEDFEGVPVWHGLRPCSPDGLPYVGRVGRYDNLSVATGHAMLGLSLGPITGRLMGEILSGHEPSMEIGMLDPERYG